MVHTKTKSIRDPIYNYIEITPIEKNIIDTPDFQRLRFVLQNSTAYLTYPNANNSRFLHSLGTMHLSGKIFLQALKNSSADILIEFLSDLDRLLQSALNDVEGDYNQCHNEWEKEINDSCGFFHSPFDGGRMKIKKGYKNEKPSYTLYVDSLNNTTDSPTATLKYDPIFLINTFWQVTRLVGLVHDIGHMPMSHLFENAITKFKEKVDVIVTSKMSFEQVFEQNPPHAIHEARGMVTFHEMYPKNKNLFYIVVKKLAKQTLLSNSDVASKIIDPHANILSCLHRIVDGAIDSDRLDYCVRDAVASGIEFGSIDVERIINNMIISVYKKNDQDTGRFIILPTSKALSAIESFYHQRYLLYKYEIYHHNVSRFDGLLEEILIWMLMLACSKRNEHEKIRLIIRNANVVKETTNNKESFDVLPQEHSFSYDDAWLRSLLSKIYIALKSMKNKPNELTTIETMLETFLYRKTNNLISAWKSDSEIVNILGEDLPPQFTHPDKTKDEEKDVYKKFKQELEDKVSEIIGIKATIILKHLKPKIYQDNDISSIVDNKSMIKISSYSSYTKSLKEVIASIPDFHISFFGKDIKEQVDVEKLEKIHLCIRDVIKNYTTNIKSLRSQQDMDLAM